MNRDEEADNTSHVPYTLLKILNQLNQTRVQNLDSYESGEFLDGFKNGSVSVANDILDRLDPRNNLSSPVREDIRKRLRECIEAIAFGTFTASKILPEEAAHWPWAVNYHVDILFNTVTRTVTKNGHFTSFHRSDEEDF